MRSASYLSCMHCNADLTKKGVKRKRCAGCHSVFYDGVTCQEKDWAIHKTECKELQCRFIAAVCPDYSEVDTMAKLLARPKACGIIATCFHHGQRGLEQNHGLDIFWATQWMKGGDPKPMSLLGSIYLNGTGVPKDVSKGLKLVRRAADLGHVTAYGQVGTCYKSGQGVRADAREAIKWYRRGAEGGDVTAQRQLGMMFRFGDGVEKDEEEAAIWIRKAAEQGDSMAQHNLALLLEGHHLSERVGPDTAEAKEAVKWYRRAAEQGYAASECSLGECLRDGSGVAKDLTEGVFWIRKSADQGNANGQFELGKCYVSGTGVDVDRKEGTRLFRLSADGGCDVAKEALRIVRGM